MIKNLMTTLCSVFAAKKSVPKNQSPLYVAVREILRDVQAYAQSHGGKIELLGVSADNDVKIRLSGACSGCLLSSVTLKYGVEDQIRRQIPEVRKIIVLN